MLATTEPTLPKGCKCGMNNFTISPTGGEYSYTNKDYCYSTMNITVNIAGEIEDPEGSPGLMKENAVVSGHQLGNLKPNMVFMADWSAEGELSVVYSYACLGLGLFSFNVLARGKGYGEEEVEGMVKRAVDATGGGVDVEGVRIQDGWEGCPEFT